MNAKDLKCKTAEAQARYDEAKTTADQAKWAYEAAFGKAQEAAADLEAARLDERRAAPLGKRALAMLTEAEEKARHEPAGVFIADYREAQRNETADGLVDLGFLTRSERTAWGRRYTITDAGRARLAETKKP